MTTSIKEKELKNGMFYMLPVIVGNALPILTLPIFTRILSVEEFGIFALSQVYAIFISGISNFGLTIGYERNFYESEERSKRAGLLFSTLLFVISTFTFFGILTFIFKGVLAKLIIGSQKYSYIIFWSYCSTGVTSLKAYYLIYLKNTENAKAYVWYTIDENLIGVALSLFMVAYLKIGVMGMIWGPLIASAGVFIVLSVRFIRQLPVVLNWELLKDSLRISLPLTPRIFFGVIGNQFDKYMIGLLSSVGGAGIYNLGQKIANIVFTFMTAIQNVFAPQVYKRMFEMDEENGGKSIGIYLTPFVYISISGALMVSLFSEEIIMLLTPKSYHGAIEIVSILSMLFATYFFGKQPQLIYAKKTAITSWLTLVGIALNILINIPFISYWGVIGAAYGTLLAGLISGIISFVVSQRYYEIKWEYSKIGLIYFLYFLFTFSTIFLRDFDVSYELRMMCKLVCIGAFAVIGINLGYITKRNFDMVVSMLKSGKKKSI
jgi:O-antigen/teichoic acid export membrane protein